MRRLFAATRRGERTTGPTTQSRTYPRQERSLEPGSRHDVAGHDTLVVRATPQPRRAEQASRGTEPRSQTRRTIGLRYLAVTHNGGASRGVKDPRRITPAAQRQRRAR